MFESELILHQFLASHFNEKVRWALDYKGIRHCRLDYLPGPHAPRIKKLSGSSSSTPLLQHSEGTISGSAAIIDWLECEYPEPALYPKDPAQREQALSFQSHYDQQVGPATRTVIFSYLINSPDYLCQTFSHSKGWAKRLLYRGMFPLAKPLIAKENKVNNPVDIELALDVTNRTLSDLSNLIARKDYLAGDSFSVADLTAASLLAPLAQVAHRDMSLQTPIPDDLKEYLLSLEGHPAINWVQKQYRMHRPETYSR